MSERFDNFKSELFELCRKYNVSLYVSSHGYLEVSDSTGAPYDYYLDEIEDETDNVP